MKNLRDLVLILGITMALVCIVDLSLNAAAWLNTFRKTLSTSGAAFIQRDPQIGWVAIPNKRVIRNLHDADGKAYQATISIFEHGFRRIDRGPNKPVLLVVGDSFTHALEVGNGDTYFDVFANSLPGWNIVAYGISGWGTLQQALWVERLLTTGSVRPQAVLLQLSSNDIVNNSYGLEQVSWQSNNLQPRPYLQEDGSILLQNPKRWYEYSWLLRQLSKHGVLPRGDSIENRIIASEPDAKTLYRLEIGNTAKALTVLRSLLSDAEAYAFLTDQMPVFADDLARFAGAAGFEVLGVAEQFAALERRSIQTFRSADGAHWNVAGHKAMGRLLAAELKVKLSR